MRAEAGRSRGPDSDLGIKTLQHVSERQALKWIQVSLFGSISLKWRAKFHCIALFSLWHLYF